MDPRIRKDQRSLKTVAEKAANEGVKVSFHITPAALSFTLALLTALVGLIVWLTDKPSRAEVERTIDLKQQPVITRLDDLKSDVTGFRQEFREYIRVTPQTAPHR